MCSKKIIFYLLFSILHFIAIAQTQVLQSNWKFKNTNDSNWLQATVPGTVHTDLLNANSIPDPFFGTNEKDLQWIHKVSWEYKTTFDITKNIATTKNIVLQFDGLDTYATIYLNDIKIGQTNNMFRTYKLDVSKWLKQKNNTLHIVFESAEKIADSLAKTSNIQYPCENNRNLIRKAQYHFGWDWAPTFITCGIWRTVSLLFDPTEKIQKAQYSPVKLIQEKDSIGQSFYFTVNSIPAFMKGANWIPADVFLPRVSKEKYRNLLIATKEAGMNMLRVWGGGVYEDDYFYTLCDSLGIYVWQDFMFAGAMYPASNEDIENIKQEAIDNILRLRKHKCIVLWCGNNEIDEAWHNWGWQSQNSISENDSIKLWNDYQKIFYELLPSLVKKYDSERAYIPSTPLYGWGRAQSMTHGDSHYWGLWWGLDSINVMSKKVPRFMSEYGMQAMPNMESVMLYATLNNMDTSSQVMKTHQKHPTGYATLARYIQMENIQVTNFQSYINATQELQHRAIHTALSTQFHSNGRCMGSLLWQLNDCWPVCSWSVIDYFGNKKKGYYTIKEIK